MLPQLGSDQLRQKELWSVGALSGKLCGDQVRIHGGCRSRQASLHIGRQVPSRSLDVLSKI